MRISKKQFLTSTNIRNIILITAGLIYLTINFCNQYFYRTFTIDYGVYNFAFYDIAHFRVSDCPVYFHHQVNFLQDHVSFTFFLFIPFYWIFGWLTGTYTLMFIQTFLILYGGWAVYKIIELKSEERLHPILAILLYLFMFGRWPSFIMDCNLAIIAASIVPVFLYYFEKKKILYAALAFLFILITREDMALWTFFIGLFLVITHYRERDLKLASFIIIVVSLVYFTVVFKYIIPSFETANKKFTLFNYGALGANPTEALIFIIKRPWEAIKLLFINQSGKPLYDNIKFEFYYVYLLCGGFLLFRRPKYLLLFIPLIAKKMYNDDPVRWSIELYYSIEFVSILPIAVFLIMTEEKNRIVRLILAYFVFLSTLTITVIKLNGHSRLMDWWGDKKFAFYKSSFYQADFDVKKVNKSLSIIPSNARVSFSGSLLPHFAFRKIIYQFPRVDDAEYIAVFKNKDTYPLDQENFKIELNKYTSDTTWKHLVDDQILLILKKKSIKDKPE